MESELLGILSWYDPFWAQTSRCRHNVTILGDFLDRERLAYETRSLIEYPIALIVASLQMQPVDFDVGYLLYSTAEYVNGNNR
jgi:hypothetical protein